MSENQKRIMVVGAGLSGAYLSLLLARQGYGVDCYERRPDLRQGNAEGGRSINLALSTRGIKALQRVEADEQILTCAVPMAGRMLHQLDGKIEFQAYSPVEKQSINSVSRAGLNKVLLDLCDKTNKVRFFFSHQLEQVCFQDKQATFSIGSSQAKSIGFDKIIGTDGSASALRRAMLLTPRFDFSQSHQPYGYKELCLPSMNQSFQLEPNALHIWPRKNFMLIALPNPDKTFTCTLFLPYEGIKSFAALQSENEVCNFFQINFADIYPKLANLKADFFSNPTGGLMTVRCAPWHYQDFSLLLGDAAHAIVPFYGQGMNCAFETCSLFVDKLKENQGDWGQTLNGFTTIRKPDTDAIADLAIQNFKEMQSDVADPRFLLKKQIAGALESRFPQFKSQYSLVTFSDKPYSYALQVGRKQNEMLGQLAESIQGVEELNWQKADALMEDYFKEV